MPALEPVVGVARVVLSAALAGVPCINVFHVQHQPVSAWSQPTIDQLAIKLRGFWVTRWLTGVMLSTAYVLGDVTATDLSSDLGVVGSASGSNAGNGGNAYTPANVALCASWRISRHYRGGHPRTYIGGLVPTNVLNPNSWTATAVSSAQTSMLGFLNDVNTSDYAGVSGRLVCVHRYKGKDPATGEPNVLRPPLVDLITDVSVDTRIDSQRRRLGPDR